MSVSLTLCATSPIEIDFKNNSVLVTKEPLEASINLEEPDVPQHLPINLNRSKRGYETGLKWCMWISGGIAGASAAVTFVAPNPVTPVTAALGTLAGAACGVMNLNNEVDKEPDVYDQCNASGDIISGGGQIADGIGKNTGSKGWSKAGNIGKGAGVATKISCVGVKTIKDQLHY